VYTITSSNCTSLWSLTLNEIKLSVFQHALLAHNISYSYRYTYMHIYIYIYIYIYIECVCVCMFMCVHLICSSLSSLTLHLHHMPLFVSTITTITNKWHWDSHCNTCIIKFSPCISNGTPCIVIITCLFVWFCQQYMQSFIFYTFFFGLLSC